MNRPYSFEWIEEQEPATLPYRPGAAFTGDDFGLRKDFFGSPIHPGTDRGGSPDVLQHPFGGAYLWKMLPRGYALGSLLRILPADPAKIEVQVAHTYSSEKDDVDSGSCRKGAQLPGIHVGDIGLAKGLHTHTDVLIPATIDNVSWLREFDAQYIADGKIVDENFVASHCEKWGLSLRSFTVNMVKQISSWNISEAGRHYIVRDAVPAYRIPLFGKGPVIFLDSKYFLQI